MVDESGSVSDHNRPSDGPNKSRGSSQDSARPPRPNERNALLAMMGRAFFDDPLAIYLFPDENKRRASFAGMCGLTIDHFGESAILLTNDTLRGLAIWQKPERTPPSRMTSYMIFVRTFLVMGRSVSRAVGLEEIVFAHRPKEPHYYLSTLGTDPDYQGQGIGSTLMRPVLERCDAEKMPAYLESSKAKNTPFYSKHGFEITNEDKLPNGEPFFLMYRHPH